ncbi:MAG: family 43 glycosylhydrolase [Chryseolinea sp.]
MTHTIFTKDTKRMIRQRISIAFLVLLTHASIAQLKLNYKPEIQSPTEMQYFSPKGDNLFVGDCIPFSHNGTYYLYWLLDSAHHSALNGLGGHQWTLSTSQDLKTWKHYPVVIGVDEEWEKSICTGSVVVNNNKFYAFYATRRVVDGKVNEQLSYAISDDGIHFKKQKPNPFYTSAPGYSKRDFRDPKVFVDKNGYFHLFVSSKLSDAVVKRFDGALVHMVSKDLKTWDIKSPVLSGQSSVPECPDYFKWNDWYYLIYGDAGDTYYVKSKSPYGPWEQPEFQALVEDWSNVAKTAEFKGNRRIMASWIPSKKDNKDDGHEIFGGSAMFRELVQFPNGTLGTKFPSEMIPQTGTVLQPAMIRDSLSKEAPNNGLKIVAPNGVGTVQVKDIPRNSRITFEVEPGGVNEELGLLLRSSVDGESSYKLTFDSNQQRVTLHNTTISSVEGMDKRFKVDIVMKGDIIDVSVDGRRCVVNRLPEKKGDMLMFFAKHGQVTFDHITIAPLK